MKVSDAKICMNCDEVFDKDNQQCPACGSNSFVWLNMWLPSMEELRWK